MSELKPRTSTVVIYQGDDLDELSLLRRKAEQAKAQAEEETSGPLRVGDDVVEVDKHPAVVEARAAYDAFVDAAADRAVMVEVRAVKRSVFRDLMAKHPARDGNDEDKMFSVNMDDFPTPFLAESVASVKAGERELSQAQVRDLLDDLAEGDFDRVFATAYWLNRAPGSDPKDSKFSTAPRTSDAT